MKRYTDANRARVLQQIAAESASNRGGTKRVRSRAIKAIGSAARKEIIEAAEHNIHLFLFVKVRPDWGDDPERYRMMGLDFSK